MVRRKRLNKPEKVLKISSNPFYTAHYESKNEYQTPPHVKPMINLELYLAARSQINIFITFYEEKLHQVSSIFTTIPFCGECGKAMKHRKENTFDMGYFVCSANHKIIKE